MIAAALRMLALGLGLALGLAAAALVGGRMAHLRGLDSWLAPGSLPGWTAAVAGDAGALAGRAVLGGGLVLDWRLARLGVAGPVWALHLTGEGVALTLSAQPEGAGLALRVEGGQAVLAGEGLAGAFELTGGTGRLEAGGLWLELHGRGQRLRLAGAARPDGAVRLEITPDGDWRFEAGGQAVLTGTDPGALTGH